MPPQLDVFSFQIVAKYFYLYEDYVNAVQINKKFLNILDRFRYNPISVSTLKLFPYIETQHLYTEKDTLIPFVKRYVVWFTVSLTDSYSLFTDLEVVYKHVKIDNEDFFTNSISDINEIPKSVNIYSLSLLNNFTEITEFSVPLHVTKLKTSVFDNNTNLNCTELEHLTFSKSLFIIPNGCCDGCHVLSDVVLPENLLEICSRAFRQNYNLDVDIPKSVTKIEQDAFYECLGNIYLDVGPECKIEKDSPWDIDVLFGTYDYNKECNHVIFAEDLHIEVTSLLSKKKSTL
ncbi:leucine rich repeat containing protein BspA family protein, partial [Entamoeba invadens IP1]